MFGVYSNRHRCLRSQVAFYVIGKDIELDILSRQEEFEPVVLAPPGIVSHLDGSGVMAQESPPLRREGWMDG